MSDAGDTCTVACSPSVLLIEAFYGGSHRQLIDLLETNISGCVKYTLPAKKWHWRARTAALYFSQVIPNQQQQLSVLFTSSVLNLAELVALRPDLASLRKVLYFHENQLIYPVRKQQDRDFQYGYNQILSSLVADEVIFNSQFNMESFLSGIKGFLKLIPDHRPKDVAEKIRPKCRVLHFPVQFPKIDQFSTKPHQEHASSLDDVDYRKTTNAAKLELSDVQKHTTPQKSDSELFCKGQDDETLGFDVDMESCDNVEKKSETLRNTSGFCDGGSEASDIYGQQQYSRDDDETESLGMQKAKLHQKLREEPDRPLHIVWPHRWEHDKNPEGFFTALFRLHEEGLPFLVSVLGETYTDVPVDSSSSGIMTSKLVIRESESPQPAASLILISQITSSSVLIPYTANAITHVSASASAPKCIFEEAKSRLSLHVANWGYQESREAYYSILRAADVVVSTAQHEFFGVAMLEAVHFGCYPLCPNRLVYPEIFPSEYLYNTEQQLFKRLRQYCRRPLLVRDHNIQVDTAKYTWDSLGEAFSDLLKPKVSGENISQDH